MIHNIYFLLPFCKSDKISLMKKVKQKLAITLAAAFLVSAVFTCLTIEENLKIIPARAQESAEDSSDSENSAEEEKKKEEKKEEIDETEGYIEKYEDKKEKAEEQKGKLEQNLGQIQNFIYYTQKEINKTEESVNETEATISRKESELNFLNKKSELQKNLLGELIREMYYSRQEPFISVFLGEKKFTQMLGNIDYLSATEEKLISLIGDMKKSIA